MTRTDRARFDPRLTAALTASKLTAFGIRRLGRGGGTSAPGLVAERIDPHLLTKITSRLDAGSIVVAGTNGKTTTSRMIADILTAAGYDVVHNRSGSNLVRGVASAFAAHASILGHPRGQIGVIEADEAAFPAIVKLSKPRYILLNNLFRDQLDRYGELDTIARHWKTAFQSLDESTTIIVNGDDPTLVAITDDIRARRVTFGLDEINHRLDALPHAADAATCRVCGADLAYRALYLSHLGEWYCPNCGRERPKLDVTGSDIVLHGVDSLTLSATPRDEAPVPLEIGVPGLYNAYNTLAAYAVTREAGVAPVAIQGALAKFRSAFGRIERLDYRNRKLTMALVKNPVGFNEVLRMLTSGSDGLAVPTLIAINDRDADGRDVSWLWDVDFELLADGEGLLGTTGIRGSDMANRLKYAGVPLDRIKMLDNDLATGLDSFVDRLPEGSSGYILPTYTAMLELRKTLADRGAVESFWQQ
ncbi:MAG TPA: Mur ligase family protein [Thermomicrobiales bacterium]|nr:Mur ligase family protein [Thermomicrobiales bacterium]